MGACERGAQMDRGDGNRAAVFAVDAVRADLPGLAAVLQPSNRRPAALPADVESAPGVVPEDPLHLFVLSGENEHGGDGAGLRTEFPLLYVGSGFFRIEIDSRATGLDAVLRIRNPGFAGIISAGEERTEG